MGDDRPTPRKHLPELDGLRGFAVLGVMIFHFLQGLPTGGSPAGLVVKGSRLGQTGADLFFVLSGFLITGILLDTRRGPHYFRNFYARRTLRIFPLHYLAVALFYFVIGPLAGLGISPMRDQLWAWLYLVNIPMTFAPETYRLPGHFWSLAVEEHFYLAWPLVVWGASRRGLVAICVTLIPLAIGCRILLYSYGFTDFFFTLCRTDSLAIGALVAILFRWRVPGLRDMMIALAVAAAICIPLWVATGGEGIPAVTMTRSTLIAVAYAILLAATVVMPADWWWKRLLSSSIPRFFGRYSYGLYVFHALISFPWKWEDFRAAVPGEIPAMAAMCSVNGAISLAAAMLSWNLLEKHCLRLKRYFEYPGRDACPRPGPTATARASDAARARAP